MRVLVPFLSLLALLSVPARAADTAPELYVGRCAMCHLPGIGGAPKVGDRQEWTRRVRAGINSVYRNAIEGIDYSAMTPKAGHTDLTDAQIRAVVDYMLSGASLAPEAVQAAARYDKLGISHRDFIRLDADFDGFRHARSSRTIPYCSSALAASTPTATAS